MQQPPFPTAMFGAMSFVIGIYFLVMIGVTLIVLIALWRAMRAHENIARQLEHIAEALGKPHAG